MNAHILLVDDDLLVGKLLTFLLDDAGYAMTALADPRRASAFLRDNSVDLVLLDITLPHQDGYALAKELRGAYPDIPIIFLSARAQVSDKVTGFDHGADDYVTKPFEPTELLARIEAVLRRYRRAERHIVGSTIIVGEACLDLGELRFSAPGRPPVLLTPTEMKILECLMRNANTVITREALIERTWGYACDDYGNRVDVYIRRVRAKIEADPGDPAFIETVRNLGYLFRAAKRSAVA
ncbi:MAG: response regulator transcription factor [Thermomicrobia bacterium]|nr:response regulator transcription factor [Thermomicrobia bacterium]